MTSAAAYPLIRSARGSNDDPPVGVEHENGVVGQASTSARNIPSLAPAVPPPAAVLEQFVRVF